MTLKEPIVEGAHDKAVGEVVDCLVFALNAGVPKERLARLARSVLEIHIIPTDPAELVAELRRMVTEAHHEFDAARDRFDAGLSTGYHESARIVAEKLGVK